MRWLYHLLPSAAPLEDPYAPPSLLQEGFVHASFQDVVRDSAGLHFPAGADLQALRIDPRRLDVRVQVVDTPRGPMPHIHGPIPRDAIVARHGLDDLCTAPDRVTGTRIGCVAFPGMTLLDLVGAYDPLSRIRSMGFDPSSRCEIISASTPRVFDDAGVRIEVARIRPALHEFDVVVVPGGYGARALAQEREVAAWLAAFPGNRLMASVCTGALLLGAAGRLRGRRATTHHTELEALRAHGAQPVQERVVDEGPTVTAGGVTAAIDLGLHLVGRLEGKEVARAIAAQMAWQWDGAGG